MDEPQDIDPDTLDAAVLAERDRLAATLRYLAERIEAAPLDRLAECAAWIVDALEPLARTVDRGLGRDYPAPPACRVLAPGDPDALSCVPDDAVYKPR